MRQQPELGDFLRSRRARLTPAEVGLPTYGERRRVEGLRREEVAQLAGLSTAYYTRLEQGYGAGASLEVLDCLATALRLDDVERQHLHDLTRRSGARRAGSVQRPRATVISLLKAMGSVPAVVLGRYCDLLAWNQLGVALLLPHVEVGHLAGTTPGPNMARAVFCDPHLRDLYGDWPSKARETVAYLRLMSGRHPRDRRLAELVGELTIASPDFTALWAAHPVAEKAHGRRVLNHPQVGHLNLNYDTLSLPEPDQVLVAFHAADSLTTASLQLLGSLSLRTATMTRDQPHTVAGSGAADADPGIRGSAEGPD